MKRLILAVSLVAIAMTASAQIKSAADIQKAIASAEKVAENPKKAANVATWIKIGEAYLNAYENPTSNVVGGDKQQLALVMGNDKPLSSEAVTLGGQPYEKVVYKDKNLYFDQNGQLAMTEVTNPSYQGDALSKAIEAYKKAAEVDVKGKKIKDIKQALEKIASNYNQDAFTAYYLGNPSKASQLFEKSAVGLLFRNLFLWGAYFATNLSGFLVCVEEHPFETAALHGWILATGVKVLTIVQVFNDTIVAIHRTLSFQTYSETSVNILTFTCFRMNQHTLKRHRCFIPTHIKDIIWCS